MAQTSAAREPSMEEILASIRRIIETGDTANDEAESREPSRVAAPALETVSTVSSISETLAGEAPRDTFREPARTISLADVAARLRGAPDAESESHDDLRHETPTLSDPVSPSTTPMDEKSLADFQAVSSSLGAADVSLRPEMQVAVASAHSSVGEGLQLRPSLTLAASREEVAESDNLQEHGSSERENRFEGSERGGELISRDAGEKVTAAFEDLNEAVIRSRMRSFDEIAEEMLRPMLKDWLDDNLPTLVERLVREEIERVARGGRR